MPRNSSRTDVAVIGGGAIGLSAAWRAAQRGLHVTVLDAGEPGAWRAAAGMLAPVAESDFGERALLELGLRSAERYEAFCAEVAEASGRDTGLRRSGTLVVARDSDEAAELDRLLALRTSLGLHVERLRPSQARRAESGARADRAPRARHPRRPLGRPPPARGRAGRGGGARRRRGPPARARRPRPHRGRARDRRRAGRRRADRGRARADGGRRVVRAHRGPARRGTGAGAPRQGPDPAPARPGRPGARDPRDPHPHRLPRPARRRALRARRDDGGARLGHRRRPRAGCSSCCATCGRSCRGCSSSSSRRSASGCARARRTTCRASAPARSRACTGRRGTGATGSCWRR